MKKLLLATAALALVGVNAATAGDIVYKPIDTSKLVVQPSRTAANLASQAIALAGNTTAAAADNNGWIKTINNIFSRKIIVPHTQAGPSPLPSPNLFPSTQYKNYNTPMMPINKPR